MRTAGVIEYKIPHNMVDNFRKGNIKILKRISASVCYPLSATECATSYLVNLVRNAEILRSLFVVVLLVS